MMSRLTNIERGTHGYGLRTCTWPRWQPQKRLADERSPRGQRLSHRACLRLALDQAADKASRKIVASIRVGTTCASTIRSMAPNQRPLIRSPISVLGERSQRTPRRRRPRQSLPAHGHPRERVAGVSCRTSVDLCAVEVVILAQRADTIFQADRPAEILEMIRISTQHARWRALLTPTKQAVDRADRGEPAHGTCGRASPSATALPEGVGAARCNSRKPGVGHGLVRLQHGSGRRDA
jgi:hypothetical protein